MTADNAPVAVKDYRDFGLGEAGALTGADVDGLSDDELVLAIERTTDGVRPDESAAQGSAGVRAARERA